VLYPAPFSRVSDIKICPTTAPVASIVVRRPILSSESLTSRRTAAARRSMKPSECRPFPERHSVGLWRLFLPERQRPARGSHAFARLRITCFGRPWSISSKRRPLCSPACAARWRAPSKRPRPRLQWHRRARPEPLRHPTAFRHGPADHSRSPRGPLERPDQSAVSGANSLAGFQSGSCWSC
jgi:hypothetical protein